MADAAVNGVLRHSWSNVGPSGSPGGSDGIAPVSRGSHTRSPWCARQRPGDGQSQPRAAVITIAGGVQPDQEVPTARWVSPTPATSPMFGNQHDRVHVPGGSGPPAGHRPSIEGTNMGDSGPEEAVKGVVEDVKGKAKEVVGIVSGHDDLREEGRAQQDKADAQRDVAKKEAEAEAARAAEKTAESRQKAAE